MDKISVNKLVEEVKSNLPREILVLIAQNCLNENTDNQTTIKNFENEVYKYTLKVQKKSYQLYWDIVTYEPWKSTN